ncbi:siderophore-interacting protein [Roseibium suaedae]|uniref:NADPH-dependent ferric siderophore reductase, contains FAD-binding and SIP domains n=1 Tax=Roseibium suaedae TaxID=735517 RepID=A0A1M7GUQ1_9HYPH|nr:siderophore-interacting protein [Roseibium suaedae]SHM19980.1 NADPH-dependent ferric siderophore reductase, contains FAD-binding and SIP domains [Roseibium suaedae]
MQRPVRPNPRILTVKSSRYVTPHMIRVTLTGDSLADFPLGQEGAHCKLAFPRDGEDKDSFASHYAAGRPKERLHAVRTYTVRAFRQAEREMDIGFVAHGDSGPGTLWAQKAEEGSFLAFMGPGPVKMTHFHADWYLVAADMSALPVAAASLEAMPADAKGLAIFEILSEEDRQTDIRIPEGIEVHWLVQPDPHVATSIQIDFLRAQPWPEGRVQTCIAGESTAIRSFREFVLKDKGVDKADAYISGYWKVGLVEDEHQEMKRLEPA